MRHRRDRERVVGCLLVVTLAAGATRCDRGGGGGGGGEHAAVPSISADARATLESARALLDRGRYAAAESLGLAQLSAAATPRDSVATALLLDVVVEAARRGGRSTATDTRVRAERAVRLKEAALGPDAPELAASLSNLAIVVEEGGDYAAARPLQERALRIRTAALGPDHPDVAASWHDLGILLMQTAEYDSAQVALERGLAIRERAYGPTHLEVAQSLNALAQLRAVVGDMAGARQAYERVLAIRVSLRGPDHPDVAGALNNLATYLIGTGEYDEAQRHLERALEIREARFGPDHRLVSSTLSNLALVHRHKKEFAIAAPLYERAIAIAETAYGKMHPTLALYASSYGNMLFEAGELPAAEARLERALAIREAQLGPEHPLVGVSLGDLAALRREQGHVRQSIPLLLRAVAIRESAFAPGDPGAAEPLRELALAYAQTGERARGFEAAIRAEDLAREHQRLAARTLSEHEALRYGRVRAQGLDLAIGIALAGGDAAMQQRAWDSLLRTRGMVLDEAAERARWVAQAEDPESARLASKLADERTRLARLQVRGPGAMTPAAYRALLERVAREKNDAERALASHSARFRDEQHRRRIGFAEVAARLAPEDALVAFAVYERTADGPSYAAFVLSGRDRTVRALDLGPAPVIDGLCARWSQELSRGTAEPGRKPAEAEAACTAAGSELRRRVWDPLAVDAIAPRRLFIVPDGALLVLDLAALPAASGGYLVEQQPVLHTLSSERDLIPVVGAQPTNRGLLAIGGPAFDLASGEVSRAGSPAGMDAVPAAHRDVVSRAGSALEGVHFVPLPAAAQETRAVSDVWRRTHEGQRGGAGPVRTCVGRDATEAAFKRFGPGKQVLHIATHGFFLGAGGVPASSAARGLGVVAAGAGAGAGADVAPAPIMLRSGLAFAGANAMAGGSARDSEDGVLTAEEIAALDLQGVEWAVLSACDTGLGDVQSREGVFGLRRAFHVAGVRTLIISLWSVNDEMSSRWMEELYAGRFERKLDTADAVRQASLALLRESRAGGKTGHPYYWAGFVAAGDWR